jgi:succinate dehydrogenase/fumarate reductase flavoprotein subunit
VLNKTDLRTDVLVVGSGAAGMMAAVRAADRGADVALITKGGLFTGSTQMAGAFAAALGHSDPRDNPEVHLSDTLRASSGLADPCLARVMAERAPGVAVDLDAWGADLDKLEDGRFHQKPNAGHTYPRGIGRSEDIVGPTILRTVEHRLREGSVRVLDHTMVLDVVLAGDRVVGAVALDVRAERLLAIRARTVVLATGGGAEVFDRNDTPPVITGDGYGIALRAGARLADMEMVEFSLAPIAPNYCARPSPLFQGGGRLYNGIGERYMCRYDPERLEKTRDRTLLCKAAALEVRAGRGTPGGGVYLDLSGLDPQSGPLARMPAVRQLFLHHGVDLNYQPMELASGAHTFIGGVVIDEQSRTGVPGLLAAGETTGRVHGAARLGQNPLCDALVFGSVAGEATFGDVAPSAEREVESTAVAVAQRLSRMLDRGAGRDVEVVRREMQQAMGRDAAVLRDEAGLRRVMEKVRELRHEVVSGVVVRHKAPSMAILRLRAALELENLLLTAEAVVSSALERRESRGVHSRLDYPEQDDANWRRNIFVALQGGEIVAKPGPMNGVTQT